MKQCEDYTLGTVPGSRFCDKATARTMQAFIDFMEFRGSLLCALAFDHMRDRDDVRNPDCFSGTCVFCDAERAYRGRL